jgi:threonine synthase
MRYLAGLRCLGCGAEYPPDTLMNLCPVDQRPVTVVLDIPAIRKKFPGDSWLNRGQLSMWHFGPLLPLHSDNPADRQAILSLGEGNTPLLPYDDYPLARRHGFHLAVKDEGQPHPGYGANPTRSFKDRGMAMTVSMARKMGVTKCVVPTQGNAGDSLAMYGLQFGFDVAIVMPDDTPMTILGRVAALEKMHPNIHLDVVKGTIREAAQRMKEKYLPQGYFNVATFQEPGWRIEGKKTLGLEIAEPRERDGRWQLPDVIVYPTGGGTGVLGMWKAFDELEQLGLIGGERPKMVCVQMEQTAPVVKAFDVGASDTQPQTAGRTLACGLNVPGGVGHFHVLEIIRKSGGLAVAVSEAAMIQACRDAWVNKRWWVGPEGGACLAAMETLVDQGILTSGMRVITFNTGSPLKYLPEAEKLFL